MYSGVSQGIQVTDVTHVYSPSIPTMPAWNAGVKGAIDLGEETSIVWRNQMKRTFAKTGTISIESYFISAWIVLNDVFPFWKE